MDETRDTDEKTIGAPGGVTMLAIPEEHIDKVLAYVASLQQEDAEVAGYGRSTFQRAGSSGIGTLCTTTGHSLVNDTFCGDLSRK